MTSSGSIIDTSVVVSDLIGVSILDVILGVSSVVDTSIMDAISGVFAWWCDVIAC